VNVAHESLAVVVAQGVEEGDMSLGQIGGHSGVAFLGIAYNDVEALVLNVVALQIVVELGPYLLLPFAHEGRVCTVFGKAQQLFVDVGLSAPLFNAASAQDKDETYDLKISHISCKSTKKC
jgi:hypothetical protein